jgi:hypothetical protein
MFRTGGTRLRQPDAGIILGRIQDPVLANGKHLGARVGTVEVRRIARAGAIVAGSHEKAAQSGRQKQARTSYQRSTPGGWDKGDKHRKDSSRPLAK